jgi:peptide/nickel transport system permease protein
MTRYIVRRFLQMVPLLIGISILAFLIIRLAPGDPTSVYIDPNKPPPSAEDLERLRTELGLNDPLPVQYVHWLTNMLQGDLGFSLSGRRPVLDEIVDRLPNTALLGLSALIVTAVISIPVGILSALYRYTFIDYLVTLLSFLGLSIPGFVIALFLIQVFAVQLDWLPTTGMRNVREDYEGWRAALDVAEHLILPTIALSLSTIARWARFQRSSLLDVLSQDYMRTARAKGLSQRIVLWSHALRNSLLPMITLVGLSIPMLVSGAFIIEYVFGWPGMGRLAVNAALRRDYPVIMGVTMISALFIVLGNFLADVAYYWADPRIHYE